MSMDLTLEEWDALDFGLNPEGELCGRCGEPARGFAEVGDVRLCHPNRPGMPDCYTLYSHETSPVWRRGDAELDYLDSLLAAGISPRLPAAVERARQVRIAEMSRALSDPPSRRAASRTPPTA